MGQDAIKLELIQWLTRLENCETIEFLKIVKDSQSVDNDWWDDLPESQKKGIEYGLNDIKNGLTLSHDVVKAKYGI